MTREELEQRLADAEAIITKVVEAHRYYTPQHEYHAQAVDMLKDSNGPHAGKACQLIYAYYVRWWPDRVKP